MAILLLFNGVIDDAHKHIEGFAEIQIGIVNGQHTFRCGREIRDLGISLVSCRNVFRANSGSRLPCSTGLADFLTSGKQYTHFSIRRNDRGDVTAFGNHASTFGEGIGSRFTSNIRALCGNKHMTNRNDVRHLGHMG